MRAVKDSPDRYREGASAFPALPAGIGAVAAGVAPDRLAVTVGANRATDPTAPFQDALLLALAF